MTKLAGWTWRKFGKIKQDPTTRIIVVSSNHNNNKNKKKQKKNKYNNNNRNNNKNKHEHGRPSYQRTNKKSWSTGSYQWVGHVICEGNHEKDDGDVWRKHDHMTGGWVFPSCYRDGFLNNLSNIGQTSIPPPKKKRVCLVVSSSSENEKQCVRSKENIIFSDPMVSLHVTCVYCVSKAI